MSQWMQFYYVLTRQFPQTEKEVRKRPKRYQKSSKNDLQNFCRNLG